MNKRQAAVTDISLFYISCLCTSQLVTHAIRNIFSWSLVSNTESRYSLDDWYQITELIKLPHYQKVLTLWKKISSNIRKKKKNFTSTYRKEITFVSEYTTFCCIPSHSPGNKTIISIHPPFSKEAQQIATVTQPPVLLGSRKTHSAALDSF